MNKISAEEKISFAHITLEDRAIYEKYLTAEGERGCEFSFANLYMWGRQTFAELDGHIALFSQFSQRSVYPYPLGTADKKSILDAIIADSKSRGIPCRITGIVGDGRAIIEELYPGKFRFHSDEGSYDYVYLVDDLADLKGKKYHGKRNHLYRFADAHPNYRVLPVNHETVSLAREFSEEWYKRRLADDPDADFHMERAALKKAFDSFAELGMCGLILLDGDEVLAFTLASRPYADTLDVHFEKARADVQGAYAAINCEFAKFVRENYPEVIYLNREEDMGLEGLRRAKQSYHPHHRIEKCWACLLEDGYDY